jgi:hypothetical protein
VTLEEIVDSFIAEVEREVDHRERSPGGQQVTHRGDFVSAQPSTYHKLKWWAAAMLAARQAPPRPLTVADALRDADVRAGRKWIHVDDEHGIVLRRINDTDVPRLGMQLLRFDLLDAPCSLIDAEVAL